MGCWSGTSPPWSYDEGPWSPVDDPWSGVDPKCWPAMGFEGISRCWAPGYSGEGFGNCDPNAVIGYTTLGMQVNEEQTLQALVDGVLDDDTTYTWAVASGGGSLTGSPNNQVTYTAASSNDASCSLNSTITLSCNDVIIDSITVAINAYAGTAWAYKIWQGCVPHGIEGRYYKLMDGYSCDGVHQFGPNYSCGGTDEANCIAVCPPVGIEDVRTQVMKDGGCCPEALL